MLEVIKFEEATLSRSTLAGYAATALKQTVKRADHLYKALRHDNGITPGDTIIRYIDTIPVVGDIVRAITGDSSDYDDQMNEVVNNILAELKSLSEIQADTLNLIQKLQGDINLVVFKIQIATASKTINSCHTDLILFLQNPKSVPESDRFLKCYYTVITEIRHIGRIVTEKEYTVESPKLFSFMITDDGFCNGTKIIKTYKYLLGHVVLGCETAVLSEAVKYGNTSSTFSRECSALIQDIEQHMREIYSDCTNDDCSQVIDVLTSVIQTNYHQTLNKTAKEMSLRLPWFSFTTFMFGNDPEGRMFGNLLPSFVSFQHAETYFIVIWTPYKTFLDHGHDLLFFVLEFDANHLISEFQSMNILKNVDSNPSVVVGYFRNETNTTDSYDRCSRQSRITIESKHLDTPNENCCDFSKSSILVLIFSYAVLLMSVKIITIS